MMSPWMDARTSVVDELIGLENWFSFKLSWPRTQLTMSESSVALVALKAVWKVPAGRLAFLKSVSVLVQLKQVKTFRFACSVVVG